MERQTGKRVSYGKLVRDRIPEIITAEGNAPVHRTLGEAEFTAALLNKVVEEAEELRAAVPGHHLEELADVHEVLAALTAALGHSQADVEAAAARKRHSRGGFQRRVWLDEVRCD